MCCAQIRHRSKAETLLVRVDISLSAGGTLLACLSHTHDDFAPYRIDNCTSEALHIQQVRYSTGHNIYRGIGTWYTFTGTTSCPTHIFHRHTTTAC